MPSDRKPALIFPVAVALLLLIGAYVGLYYWLVEIPPLDGPFGDGSGVTPAWYRSWDRQSSTDDSSWAMFFAPVNWLDRHIRPGAWGTAPAALDPQP